MGTILTETSTFDATLTIPNPGEYVKISVPMGTYRIKGTSTPDGDLIFSNATNALVRVRVLFGISMTLSVTAVGNDVTIQSATDGLGNPTSTANSVVAAWTAYAPAVALATLVAGGLGTGLVGQNGVYMLIGDDDVGSIRPILQKIANRTRYLVNKVLGILFGTLSVKSLYADGTGDLVVAPTAGSVFASSNVTAGNNVTAQNNVISLTGNVNAAGGNVNALQNVTAGNELNGNHIQLSRTMSLAAVPSASYPVGSGGMGSLMVGAMSVNGIADPGVDIVSSMNVASIKHPMKNKYIITFNFNCTYSYVGFTVTKNASLINIRTISSAVRRTSTSPLTLETYIEVRDTLGADDSDDYGFNLIVFAE